MRAQGIFQRLPAVAPQSQRGDVHRVHREVVMMGAVARRWTRAAVARLTEAVLQCLASFRLKVAAVGGNVVRDPVRERASRRIRIVDDQREASGPLWWLENVQLRNCVAVITGESGRHRVAVSKCRTGYGECHRILVCRRATDARTVIGRSTARLCCEGLEHALRARR